MSDDFQMINCSLLLCRHRRLDWRQRSTAEDNKNGQNQLLPYCGYKTFFQALKSLSF